ncbi:hypothetical protein [Pseudomonas eucalypticola]|uniref:Uncharacterized protein n=1 Tax=Pseudomonas eucalypticola TaxID=2599595 RepID=A0A7D5HVL2_9PSED|nr:hypothetical protein [Pseudomonas eucalypticola]QKZ03751.1 hypothetical protein HWQ56_08125 [Pseudomonas eucalypticola]
MNTLNASFVAALYCVAQKHHGPVNVVTAPGRSATGRLRIERGDHSPTLFSFSSVGGEDTSLGFEVLSIDGADTYVGTALGIDSAGYLGLHSADQGMDRWYLQAMDEGEAQAPARFTLQDEYGQAVFIEALGDTNDRFFNVMDGNVPAIFELRAVV